MDLRVVLVRPRHAGNIGAALRACANFGVAEIALVSPAAWQDDPERGQLAMGAEAIVRIGEVATLPEALTGIEVAVGTTSARSRDPRSLHTPEEVRARLAASSAGRVAVVFGPERSGLTKAELRSCHLLATVPASPAFPVLNLAQAVAVVLAGLTSGTVDRPASSDPRDRVAPHDELVAALEQLEAALAASGFLDPVNPARVMDQLRRLVGRALPTGRELAILRGLAAHLDYMGGRTSRAG